MSSYKYDVFLSIKKDDTFNQWFIDSFFPLFKSYVTNDIIAKCKRMPKEIFYYKKDLQPGDPWPDDLREAIKCSRCVLALCSPMYFYSKWCLTELYSFIERINQKRVKVVVPISIHDGDSFPDDVKNLNPKNFSDFVIVGDGFKATSTYGDFQKEVKALSERVADLVAAAPPYEEWPIIEKEPPDEDDIDIQQETME